MIRPQFNLTTCLWRLYDTHEIKSILRQLSDLKVGACSGLTLHLDKLSVLSLSMEAVLSIPAFKGEG